ncbi:MAG: flagellar biosynthetic protein FliR [Pseudomonadota bacterium]|nr:flagellar biosynthetic protein FliR [Pseudomonadota bacterium]
MTLSAAEIQALLMNYFGPFCRITGLLLVAPIFSAAFIPIRVRLGLAVALTVVIAPMLPSSQPSYSDSVWVLMIVQQLMLGVAMGFVVQLVFNAIVIGGQAIAMSMGLGFAFSIDQQNGVSVPVLSQFYLMIGTLLFLALNGHLILIRVLAESFQVLPVTAMALTKEGLWLIVTFGARMFSGAVQIALPALAAILIVNLAFGITSRAAPTLNLFAVGFPVSMLLGFLVLMWSIPNLQPVLMTLTNDSFELIWALLIGER